MSPWARVVAILSCGALALGTVACGPSPKLMRPDAHTVLEEVEVGDQFYILASNGEEYYLDIGYVGPDAVRGRDPGTGKTYTFPVKDIVVIRKVGAPGAAVLVGVLAVGGVLLAIALVNAMSDFFEAVQCGASLGTDCEN